ncbi:hypothetical protein THAOC_07521 [Thalassiosira oceanica]|uniref:Uncharacterized protein n=1 Tax=Thalassiosira oceanica TaxID=159749 RepID=K0TC76_THAOC|nr:hypothetical protein THAOC_07521 [Thalassiosira oceanica]|eukprot:EJK71071.1 hypothetical protein THAOC_07521 [Thalassiosira oceanica]
MTIALSLQKPLSHPLPHDSVVDPAPPPQVLRDDLLEDLDESCLHGTRAPVLPLSAPVLSADPRQLVVVLEEEPEPLVANVHV